MSDREREAVEAVHGAHRALHGKKALIVDDDMRNIFALATVLDDEGMVIVSADNGREAIRLVEADPSIDIVLMDIMMPEMDGIATMQEIRKLPRGRELPMVAVTAKAMKGDRAEVHRGRRLGLPLQAGRSDAPAGGAAGAGCAADARQFDDARRATTASAPASSSSTTCRRSCSSSRPCSRTWARTWSSRARAREALREILQDASSR